MKLSLILYFDKLRPSPTTKNNADFINYQLTNFGNFINY